MHRYNKLEDYIKILRKTNYNDEKQYNQHKEKWNKNKQKEIWKEKQLHGHFNQQTSEILQEKIWTDKRKP